MHIKSCLAGRRVDTGDGLTMSGIPLIGMKGNEPWAMPPKVLLIDYIDVIV